MGWDKFIYDKKDTVKIQYPKGYVPKGKKDKETEKEKGKGKDKEKKRGKSALEIQWGDLAVPEESQMKD